MRGRAAGWSATHGASDGQEILAGGVSGSLGSVVAYGQQAHEREPARDVAVRGLAARPLMEEPRVRPQPQAAVGAPLSRVDGRLKVTGKALYAAEHDVDGAVHAVIVDASIGRGRIRSVDTGAADELTPAESIRFFSPAHRQLRNSATPKSSRAITHRLQSGSARRWEPRRKWSRVPVKVAYCGFHDAGWSSSVARWAHNPEVAGSNPVPATAEEGPDPGDPGPLAFPHVPGRAEHDRERRSHAAARLRRQDKVQSLVPVWVPRPDASSWPGLRICGSRIGAGSAAVRSTRSRVGRSAKIRMVGPSAWRTPTWFTS